MAALKQLEYEKIEPYWCHSTKQYDDKHYINCQLKSGHKGEHHWSNLEVIEW